MTPEKVFAAVDGWELALWRYRGEVTRSCPVLLVHGLASNHLLFDPAPEVSFARHLAGRGYDVFALELRGHGASRRTRPGARYGWSFADFLRLDLPAAERLVLSTTGAKALHGVGHSMGGILFLARLADGGNGYRSVISVGSSLDYSGSPSQFHRITPLKPVLRRIPGYPWQFAARVGAAVAPLMPKPFFNFHLNPANVDMPLIQKLMREAVHDLSTPVLLDLSTAFEKGGLRLDGGAPLSERLSTSRTPMLMVAGDADLQCPPKAVEATFEAAGGADKKLAVFPGYGHMDLLIGRRAPTEVYPTLTAWLERSS